VDLTEDDGPGWRFIAAATGSFMEAKGLESPGKSKEDQGRRDEDTEVEMNQAGVLQDGVGRGHIVLFTQFVDIRQRKSYIYLPDTPLFEAHYLCGLEAGGKNGPPGWAALESAAFRSRLNGVRSGFDESAADGSGSAEKAGCHEAKGAGFRDRAIAGGGGKVNLTTTTTDADAENIGLRDEVSAAYIDGANADANANACADICSDRCIAQGRISEGQREILTRDRRSDDRN